jgi:hypothetical protein
MRCKAKFRSISYSRMCECPVLGMASDLPNFCARFACSLVIVASALGLALSELFLSFYAENWGGSIPVIINKPVERAEPSIGAASQLAPA